MGRLGGADDLKEREPLAVAATCLGGPRDIVKRVRRSTRCPIGEKCEGKRSFIAPGRLKTAAKGE